MMGVLMFMLFCIPLSFIKKSFWLSQFQYFFLIFLFISNFSFNYETLNLSYFMGVDMLSYTMVLLSLWICSLMLLASEGLYKNNYYSNLFMFVLLMLLISLYFTFVSLNFICFLK